MEEKTRLVQMYRFWADSRTSNCVEETRQVFKADVQSSLIEDILEEWLDDRMMMGGYSYLQAHCEPVGEPFTQRYIVVPLTEIDNRVIMTNIWSHYQEGENMVFVINERPESENTNT